MSSSAANDFSAGAGHASAAAEGASGQGTDAAANQEAHHHQQQQDRLVQQLQQLQQQLGLNGHSLQSCGSDSTPGADIASALDSLAAAAAAAAEHPRQLEPQTCEVGVDTRLPVIAPGPRRGSATHTSVTPYKRVRSLTNDGAGLPGSLGTSTRAPAMVPTSLGHTGMQDSQLTTNAAAVTPPAAPGGILQSSSSSRLKRHHQTAATAASAGHGPAAPAAASSGMTQQQWKRARVNEAQAQHFQVAQQFQQQYQHQLQQEQLEQHHLQAQLRIPPHEAGSLHNQHDRLANTDRSSEQQKPRSEPLQHLLQQRVQQLLLPELGKQAILQSLDPTSQCMVECGTATGVFSVDSERILCLCSSCAENKGPPGPEFMPSEFERHGGMAACKKWRFSIKVADGGPGMTLGRWLDMRGIQISSYPTKYRNPVAKSKRPLDFGRVAGVQGESGVSLDLGQLLAGLTAGDSSQLSSTLTALLGNINTGNGRSSGNTAAAASTSLQALTEKVLAAASSAAATGGPAAASAGSGNSSVLTDLAAAVAELLARAEVPALTAATEAQQPAPAAAAVGSLSGRTTADKPSVTTCLWPDTAMVGGPGGEGVPLGYAIAAQVATSTANRVDSAAHPLPGRQSINDFPATGLGSMGTGRQQMQHGQLGMLPSASSTSHPMRLCELGSWGSALPHAAQQVIQQQHSSMPPPPALHSAAVSDGQLAHAAENSALPTAAIDRATLREYSGDGAAATAGLLGPGPTVASPGGSAPLPRPSARWSGGDILGGSLGRPLGSYPHQQLQQLPHRGSLASQGSIRPPAILTLPQIRASAANDVALGPAGDGRVKEWAEAVGGAAAAASPERAADWHTIVGSLESRLDLLLEDRRRRKELEEEVAAQRLHVEQLQKQVADERRRRLAAEQQLASLSSLLLQKLDDKLDDVGSDRQPQRVQQEQRGQPSLQEQEQQDTEPAVNGAAALVEQQVGGLHDDAIGTANPGTEQTIAAVASPAADSQQGLPAAGSPASAQGTKGGAASSAGEDMEAPASAAALTCNGVQGVNGLDHPPAIKQEQEETPAEV